MTAVVGLGDVKLPRLTHTGNLDLEGEGKPTRQCSKGRRIPSPATEFGQRDRKEKEGGLCE
jgi:hypothetical protein